MNGETMWNDTHSKSINMIKFCNSFGNLKDIDQFAGVLYMMPDALLKSLGCDLSGQQDDDIKKCFEEVLADCYDTLYCNETYREYIHDIVMGGGGWIIKDTTDLHDMVSMLYKSVPKISKVLCDLLADDIASSMPSDVQSSLKKEELQHILIDKIESDAKEMIMFCDALMPKVFCEKDLSFPSLLTIHVIPEVLKEQIIELSENFRIEESVTLSYNKALANCWLALQGAPELDGFFLRYINWDVEAVEFSETITNVELKLIGNVLEKEYPNLSHLTVQFNRKQYDVHNPVGETFERKQLRKIILNLDSIEKNLKSSDSNSNLCASQLAKCIDQIDELLSHTRDMKDILVELGNGKNT